MADKKISALTAATTPLDGTEVLPIVQSGATKKVANNDLRPRQIQSNATSGVLQIVGPAAAATRVMTTPDANFTVARTDAANSFSGDQTLSDGNLVVGTAGKGIDFSANGGDVLSQYDEGTWTPNQGAGLTVVGAFSSTGMFTRIGRQVTVQGRLVGATSIACSAFGELCTNMPFSSGTVAFSGSVFGGSPSAGGTTATAAGILYSVDAVAAGGEITFTITYFI